MTETFDQCFITRTGGYKYYLKNNV